MAVDSRVTQINGVNIPGCWLTPEYIQRKRREAVARLSEPPFVTCKRCGDLYLYKRRLNHQCWNAVDWEKTRAVLPWRKQRKETR